MMPALPLGVCGACGSSAASSAAQECCGLSVRSLGRAGMLSMQGNPARGCWKSLVSAPFHVSARARAARGDGGSSADAARSRGAHRGAGRARPGHGGARPRLAALLAKLPGKLPSRQAVLLAAAEPYEGLGGAFGGAAGEEPGTGEPWHGQAPLPALGWQQPASSSGAWWSCRNRAGNHERQFAKRPLPSSCGWVCRQGLEGTGQERGSLCSPAPVTRHGFVPAGDGGAEWPQPVEFGVGPPWPVGGGGHVEGRHTGQPPACCC